MALEYDMSAVHGASSLALPAQCGTKYSMVPEVRFELTRCLHRRILSPLRLPFRHSGPCTHHARPSYHRRPGMMPVIAYAGAA